MRISITFSDLKQDEADHLLRQAGGSSASAPAPDAIPPGSKVVEIDDVRQAVIRYAKENGTENAVKKIKDVCGVAKVSEIPQFRYEELINAL